MRYGKENGGGLDATAGAELPAWVLLIQGIPEGEKVRRDVIPKADRSAARGIPRDKLAESRLFDIVKFDKVVDIQRDTASHFRSGSKLWK